MNELVETRADGSALRWVWLDGVEVSGQAVWMKASPTAGVEVDGVVRLIADPPRVEQRPDGDWVMEIEERAGKVRWEYR